MSINPRAEMLPNIDLKKSKLDCNDFKDDLKTKENNERRFRAALKAK